MVAEPAGAQDTPSLLRLWPVLIAVALGVSAAPLDSAVNVAFPSITAAFGLDVDAAQWIVVSYVLTYASLLLGCGRIADLLGHRRVFITGIVWSMLALLVCALATSFQVFLVARFAQGVGTALLLSTGAALMTLSAHESARTRVLAAYALLFSIANAAGPLAAGALVDSFGWRSVFWFRIPVLGIALVGVLWLVRPALASSTPGETFDWRGAIALLAAVLSTMLMLNRFARDGVANPEPWFLAALSLGAIAWFVSCSLRAAHPLLELRLFRERTFAAANLTHLLVNSASFMVMLLTPFYLVRATDGSALLIGLFLGVYPLSAAMSSGLAGQILGRTGPVRLSQAGLLLAASGLALVSQWPAQLSVWLTVGALALHGFGFGLFQVAAVDVVMGTVSRGQQGVGGSLNMLTRTLGVVTGATLGSVGFAALGGGSAVSDAQFISAYETVFQLASLLVLSSMAILYAITRSR